MNWDQVEGKWTQFAGSFREKFGLLTHDDVETIGGKKDKLVGTLQEKYGHSKETAERHADDWLMSLKDEEATSTSGAPTY